MAVDRAFEQIDIYFVKTQFAQKRGQHCKSQNNTSVKVPIFEIADGSASLVGKVDWVGWVVIRLVVRLL